MEGRLYNSKDLIMRCNLNEPFSGAIDDGKGTIAYVNTEVLVKENTVGSCVYYEKRIKLRIDKVTHIVKKGDSLWAIAKKLNVSVDEIAKSNRVEDVNLIKVGDVLDINVDIRYGYQVSGMVDTLCFSPQAREYGYSPLSETVLYNILDKANAAVDNFGAALVEHAGKTRYKATNGFKLYYEKPSGRVFKGNQYVSTAPLKEVGDDLLNWTRPNTVVNNPFKTTNPLSPVKVAIPLAVALEGVEIYEGWEHDGQTFGHNTQKQIVGAAYGVAGAAIGAKYGAILLGVAGTFFFGIGTTPGAILGAFVGGFIGGWLGEDGGEYIYEELNEKSK